MRFVVDPDEVVSAGGCAWYSAQAVAREIAAAQAQVGDLPNALPGVAGVDDAVNRLLAILGGPGGAGDWAGAVQGYALTLVGTGERYRALDTARSAS